MSPRAIHSWWQMSGQTGRSWGKTKPAEMPGGGSRGWRLPLCRLCPPAPGWRDTGGTREAGRAGQGWAGAAPSPPPLRSAPWLSRSAGTLCRCIPVPHSPAHTRSTAGLPNWPGWDPVPVHPSSPALHTPAECRAPGLDHYLHAAAENHHLGFVTFTFTNACELCV